MNLPLPSAAPSSATSSRPSHSTRLKQQLLACLNLIPTVASSVRTPPPRRKGSRNDPAPPPRWIELNEALIQLDKSIAALKQGEWEKLRVVVPVLAQLSLQLNHLLCPPTTSPRYQLLRSKEYSRSLPRDHAKALLALLKRQSASLPAWAERSMEETHLLSPSLLDIPPLDSILHHLLLDVPSSTPSSPSPPRTIHLPILLSSPEQWILLPPRALEKRLAQFYPWIPPSPNPNLASSPSNPTSSSSVWSSHLLGSVTHLIVGSPPSHAPTPSPSPKLINFNHNSASRRPTTRPPPPHLPRKPPPPLTTTSKTQFRRPFSSSSSSSSSSSDEESLLSSSSSSTSSLNPPPFTGPSLETYTLHLLTQLLPSLPNLTSIHIPTPLETYPVAILGLGRLERLTFGISERGGKGAGGMLRTTAGKEGGGGARTLVDCCIGRMLELGGVRVGDLVGWEDGDEDDEAERDGLEEVLGEHLRERFWMV